MTLPTRLRTGLLVCVWVILSCMDGGDTAAVLRYPSHDHVHIQDVSPREALERVSGVFQPKELQCPICNMVIEDASISQEIRGHQNVYACSMAGHLSKLIQNSAQYLRKIEKTGVTPPYIPLQDVMTCPVCGMKDLQYSVAWGPKGNQKIFACSEEHAKMVRDNLPEYFVSNSSNNDKFCSSQSVMFDGFQSTVGGTCVLLLFRGWVLDSTTAYVLGLVGVVMLTLLLEYWGEFIASTETRLLSLYAHRRVNSDTKRECFIQSEKGNLRVVPLWCRLIFALLYMAHIALAYLVMLIVMVYDVGMFLAVLVGLGLGFFFFKDITSDSPANPDPCCST